MPFLLTEFRVFKPLFFKMLCTNIVSVKSIGLSDDIMIIKAKAYHDTTRAIRSFHEVLPNVASLSTVSVWEGL